MTSAAIPLRVLITGGSRGLGRALCSRFAADGARVAFTWASDASGAEETAVAARSAGATDVRSVRSDVLDSAATRSLVDSLEQEWGGLDVLVNNAGVTQNLPLPLISEDDWDRVMGINVKGAWLTSKVVLRGMVRRKAGVIINIGSLVGSRMLDAPVHYATSKAALEGLTRALAGQMARHRVRVVCVAPGLLEDGVGRALPPHRLDDHLRHCALGRVGTFAEVADLCALLASNGAGFVTGTTIVMDGGV